MTSFKIPIRQNQKLKKIVELVEKDVELQTYWKCSNIVAIDRLGFSDHGPTHVRIVANIGLKLLRMLVESGVKPSIARDYENMNNDDAEVVVFMASILHDVGHAIHRENHENYSIPLSIPIIERTLKSIYPVEARTILKSEILHAMISHQRDILPLTLEAGIIRVADALDMQEGRARIPFQAGEINIYSVSALAVENVQIRKGSEENNEKVIVVEISLTNSSGIFQIDEMLKKKMKNTGLEKYLQIKVNISGKSEKRIIDEFEI